MDQKIIDFLDKERIAVLSVIQEDGCPHAASVHFSHDADPFRIYIQTSRTSKKAQPLLEGSISKAAMVVGFSEEEWVTVQMQGDIRILSDQTEADQAYMVHYKKSPDAEKRRGPDTVILEFVPTWIRYTDFKTNPKTIIEM